MTKINGKEYLVESFGDISDRKVSEDRKIALKGFLNEFELRIRCYRELKKMNLQLIVGQPKLKNLSSKRSA
ncbi:MAG: hypothetical protein WCF90_08980 [Methanomicrobiales archaeon]